MRRTTSSTLAFVMFLLGTATVILRPAELVPACAGLPIYELLVVGAFALSIGRIRRRFSPRSLRTDPISVCVVGLFVAVVLSHLSHFYLYGVRESGTLFLKTFVYYALLVTLIDTPPRLRRLLMTVAGCASVMVLLGVLDYSGVFDVKFIDHVTDHSGVSDTGEEVDILRMTGTGIFHDPNDLSQLIVAAAVLCAYFATYGQGLRRFVWLLPIAVLAIGLVYTRSRGGLLSAGAAAFTLAGLRYGRKGAIATVLIGICALPLMAGRQADFSMDEGTGHDRIEQWREGFVAIQSPDLLFGIGEGLYSDLDGLVAHNSFVHAYVELGLFGGTLFFGCFFFAALGLLRMSRLTSLELPRELERFHPYLVAILAGWCAAMMTISRCYVVPTYLVVGLAASYLRLAGASATQPQPLILWNRTQCTRLLAASAMLFVGLFLITYALA